MKTALITGSTAIQVGSTRTQLGIVTAVASWRAALEDMGYTVDHRPVVPGEDLTNYDVVMSSLMAPNKNVSRYFYGALWALMTRPDAIVVMDDWQIRQLTSGVATCANNEKWAFFWFIQKDGRAAPGILEHRAALFSGLKALTEPWPWPTVVPVLGAGDASRLGVPGSVIPIDPTAYARRYDVIKVPKARAWVQASLLEKPAPIASWPVSQFGFQNRRHGGIGAPGADAQDRLPESELMRVYCGAWGVMSPPHPHAGSGWWRVRYLMAADAGCVLSADPREAACLGEPYLRASDVARVESLSDRGLASLARAQAETLADVSWPKERVKDALSAVIREVSKKRRKQMPRFTAPAPKRDVTFAPAAPPPEEKRPRGRPPAPPIATSTRPPAGGEAPFAPSAGEGSGLYMRRLIRSGYNDTDGILRAVHVHFAGSKATASDVNFNRNKIKRQDAGLEKPDGPGGATSAVAPVAQKASAPSKVRGGTPPRQAELPWEAPRTPVTLTPELTARVNAAAATARVISVPPVPVELVRATKRAGYVLDRAVGTADDLVLILRKA